MKSKTVWMATLTVTLLLIESAFAQQVTRLSGDVYLFNFGFHSNIFILTPEGVVATDPISPRAAEACLKAIRERTSQPVRYLIYSHDHADHIAGGAVFAGAEIVAHRSAAEIIAERGLSEVVAPDILVGDEGHSLELGGKQIRLLYFGRIESASNLAVYVPDDGVLMWVDAVRSHGVPYRYLEGTDLRDFRRALERVEKLEFRHLVHGHGPATDKDQVRLFRRYFDDLEKFARGQMARYSQTEHRDKAGAADPQRFFDSYIDHIAGRVLEQMRPVYGQMGGFEDWGPKNAERMVVFLLHELPFND